MYNPNLKVDNNLFTMNTSCCVAVDIITCIVKHTYTCVQHFLLCMISLLVSDNTSSWVEVQMKGKWVCLHIPSVSIDQRSVCEKQCPYKLEYVIGIDNGQYGES